MAHGNESVSFLDLLSKAVFRVVNFDDCTPTLSALHSRFQDLRTFARLRLKASRVYSCWALGLREQHGLVDRVDAVPAQVQEEDVVVVALVKDGTISWQACDPALDGRAFVFRP